MLGSDINVIRTGEGRGRDGGRAGGIELLIGCLSGQILKQNSRAWLLQLMIMVTKAGGSKGRCWLYLRDKPHLHVQQKCIHTTRERDRVYYTLYSSSIIVPLLLLHVIFFCLVVVHSTLLATASVADVCIMSRHLNSTAFLLVFWFFIIFFYFFLFFVFLSLSLSFFLRVFFCRWLSMCACCVV